MSKTRVKEAKMGNTFGWWQTKDQRMLLAYIYIQNDFKN